MDTEKAVADTPTETTETALCSRDTKQLMVRAPHELAGLCRVPDSGGREGGDLVVLEMQRILKRLSQIEVRKPDSVRDLHEEGPNGRGYARNLRVSTPSNRIAQREKP